MNNSSARLRYMLTVISFLVTMMTLLLSCIGNSTFRSQAKYVDFTFQYPTSWGLNSYPQTEESVNYMLLGPTPSSDSPIRLSISVWLKPPGSAEGEAQKIVNAYISFHKKWERNFSLVRNTTINLDGYQGYYIEFTFDAVSDYRELPEKWTYIPVRVIDISIPRNGVVYEMWIEAGQNEWNKWENDIQRVLDTFKWK